MRRRVVVLMMLLSLLLCGCREKKDDFQRALDFRNGIGSGGCSFVAEVQADYGDKVYQFTLECAYDGQDGFLKVLSPEAIAGISARVDGGSATMEFDGLSLEYGELANGYVAPLTIPWLLGSTWADDYISSAGEDNDRYLVTYLKGYHDEELTIKTWFEKNTPVFAEVSYNGQRVLSAAIREFTLNK